jgi:hypothetical protein
MAGTGCDAKNAIQQVHAEMGFVDHVDSTRFERLDRDIVI